MTDHLLSPAAMEGIFGPLLWSAAVVAFLYASIGHGGASGYLTVMALASVPAAQMRPTALVLNVAVSLVATVMFFLAGHFRGRLFWPFIVSSIPMAYVGGILRLPAGFFHGLLALALGLAAWRLFFPPQAGEQLRRPPLVGMIGIGAVLGLVSGLIGVGGGIFLTPLLILAHWADARTAAAVSAPFIFLNSLAGLAGTGLCVATDLHPAWPMMVVLVPLAGWLGASWGSGFASSATLRYALGTVLCLGVGKLLLTFSTSL